MSIIELQPALVQRIIYPWYKSLELLSPVELHKFAMFLGTVLYTCRILRQNLSNEVNFKDFKCLLGLPGVVCVCDTFQGSCRRVF